jgi:membrane fusion protein (multidrug efflux system)
MADAIEANGRNRRRVRLLGAGALVLIIGAAIWLWVTAGRESTDDAQVDGYVTPVAARVGGTVLQVPVSDNQAVDVGDTLVELDPRDFVVAVDKAKAELATATAAAAAAKSGVPVTSATTTSDITTAKSAVTQAESAVNAAEREVEAANARLASAQARQREAAANADRAQKDVDRLRGLVAKDEVSQQQFDSASATAAAQQAAVDSAVAQVHEAEAGTRVAESHLTQAKASADQAHAALTAAETGPDQVAAIQAQADAADARVEQAKAALTQAQLNLSYAVVKAPRKGIVSRKSVDVGQVVQAGQPLLAVVPLDDVWVTANFKETQITNMKVGQEVAIDVDAYGGRTFRGRIDSIAAATGARFSLLPPENATGNFVKVVQRVPVKIVLEQPPDADYPLRPGMSVTPTVYTR